jgi:hypothetical protein
VVVSIERSMLTTECPKTSQPAGIDTVVPDHCFWISASNSSEPDSRLPASIVKPDGSAVRAQRNVASIVVDSYSNEGAGLD